MRPHDESLLVGDLLGPLLYVAFRDLGHLAARLAKKMVVMFQRTQAIARLRRILADHVDRPFVGEAPQGPVHGRQPGSAAVGAQAVMKFLCREGFSSA